MRYLPCVFGFAIIAVLAGCGDSPSGVSGKAAPPPKPIALDSREKTGAELYELHCLSCHGDKGQGVSQIFPPLGGSARLASPQYFVHGLIHGFPPTGEPGASPWMGEMPKFAQLSNADIAKLATYVRKEWGGATDVITAEDVAEQRAQP
ncbi:c-type cytochrome [Cerasicoccus frondis]|uniref:c-type cytochrome n=1 Tax=Cerasicoccus frondis TaxID=490090 RepID=UPI002852A34E|nr:cytochrome c [Cerasicoccus frondis]